MTHLFNREGPMRAGRRVSLFALLAALVSLAPPALAFEYSGQLWCCDTVRYKVNPANPTHTCGIVIGQWFRGAVNAAAATWNAQGSKYQLEEIDTTTLACVEDAGNNVCAGPKDGQNVVAMAKGCNFANPNIIAWSSWWYNTQSCCIFEADMCFNDAVNWGSCTTGFPPCNSYDVQSIALHEFGHWASLGHEPDDPPSPSCQGRPSMYPSFNFCEQRRALTPDDIAGLDYAYSSTGILNSSQRCALAHVHPTSCNYPAPLQKTDCCSAAKGDVNGDGGLSPADVVLMLNCVFSGSGNCDLCFADVNCTGDLTAADVVIELQMVFLSTPAPC